MATRRPLVVVNGVTSELPSGDTTPTNSVAPGTARQLLQTNAGGTATEWTSNVDVPGTLDVTSTATFDSIAQYPAGSAGAPTITFTGDTNTGIYSPGADQVAISTGGSGRLFVNGSGNIGVASSSVQSLGANYSTLEIKGKSGGFGGGIILSPSDAATVPAVWYYDGLCNFGSLNSTPVSFLTNGTEKLRITSAGLVGVGNSNPGAKLDVSGDVIFNGGGTQFPIQFANAFTPNAQRADLFFSANATSNNALRVGTIASNGGVTLQGTRQNDSSQKVNLVLNPDGGSVGVGTTSPGALLHVEGGTENAIIGSSARKLYFRADSGGVTLGTGAGQTGNGVYFSEASNFVYAQTNSTERARIDSSGRLLVGTSSSFVSWTDWRLQVSGQASIGTYQGATTSSYGLVFIKSRSSSPGSYTIVNSQDRLGILDFKGDDGTDYETSAACIEAFVDGTPGANDMPGRLVFSVTRDGQASPTESLRITNKGETAIGSTGNVLFVGTTQASGTGNYLIIGRSAVTDGSPFTTGTDRFYVYANGNVQNTNNSYGAISDIKLKENIVDATSQWNDIKALKVRKYNFKEGETHTQIGLIAQEVELVSPGLVAESPDRDAEGNDLGTVTKSVNYSVLYMKAVKALQEAMERIEALEAKVAALESA